MKNILIIGGSYFAGRIFVEELLRQKNCHIFVFNRGNRPLNQEGVIELVGDRDDEEQIRKSIPEKQWDAVIDFCAYTPRQIELLLKVLPGAVKQYIFISTTTVYQNVHDLPVTENCPKITGPEPALGQYADYGYNKWLSECKMTELCDIKNIACTSLRPAIIYGEYNYAPRENYFFDLIRNGKTIILPDNDLPLYSFIYVVDLARIIIRVLGNEKAFGQFFNIATGELVSYRRMIEVFGKITGKKIDVQEMNLESINKEGIALPFPLDSHLIYSGDKIRDLLGFKYTSFLDGMQKTYQYYMMVQEHLQKKT